MSTRIERCDETWNPVTGCTKVSAGCKHCYAEVMAKRTFGKLCPPILVATAKGPTVRPRVFTDVQTHTDRLDQPLRWKKPRRIFVNSMSDLFHADVPDAFLDQVFAVMALADWHTFIVLTKRPERMKSCLGSMTFGASIISEPSAYKRVVAAMDQPSWLPAGKSFRRVPESWPLPNVQLGVSVENQATANERIPLLLQTPAAQRIVSYEPALGPADFSAWIRRHVVTPEGDCARWCPACGPEGPRPRIDQIIVGGESGPKARPCDVAWIRSTVRQCKAAEVACFVKQLGSRPVCVDGAATPGYPPGSRVPVRIKDSKGGDPSEWPADLRVREVV